MGQAKRRTFVTASRTVISRDLVAGAVRRSVLAATAGRGITEGLCGFHAAVGQRLLRDRYGITSCLVAGDFQRRINDRVVHSYAIGGRRIDAAVGACHVWLMETASRAVIDFDAWEEPLRYDAGGCSHGPWTAARPDYYWAAPDEGRPGIVKIVPDRQATDYVTSAMRGPGNAAVIASALAEAMAIMDGSSPDVPQVFFRAEPESAGAPG